MMKGVRIASSNAKPWPDTERIEIHDIMANILLTEELKDLNGENHAKHH